MSDMPMGLQLQSVSTREIFRYDEIFRYETNARVTPVLQPERVPFFDAGS